MGCEHWNTRYYRPLDGNMCGVEQCKNCLNPVRIHWDGVLGSVEWCDQDNIYFSKILKTPDSVSCHGETLMELEDSFIEAVKDYRSLCLEIDKSCPV